MTAALALEWGAFGLSLICSWVYGNRTIWGPILGVATAIAFMAFGIVTGIYAAAFANIIFLFVHIRNGYKLMTDNPERKYRKIEQVLRDQQNRIGHLFLNTATTGGTEDINFVRDEAHGAAKDAGWWTDINTGNPLTYDRSKSFCLIMSELGEAMEADRKNLQDDKLTHRSGVECELADVVIRALDNAGRLDFDMKFRVAELNSVLDQFGEPKTLLDGIMIVNTAVCGGWYSTIDGVNKNTADALRCVLYLTLFIGAKFDLDIPGATAEKMKYNKERPDHKLENRKKGGGKSY